MPNGKTGGRSRGLQTPSESSKAGSSTSEAALRQKLPRGTGIAGVRLSGGLGAIEAVPGGGPMAHTPAISGAPNRPRTPQGARFRTSPPGGARPGGTLVGGTGTDSGS